MAKHNEKGKLLEGIVSELHSSANLKVEKNVFFTPLNGNKKKREIDVLITANIFGYESYIVFECKNNKNKIGVKEIDSFYGKLEHLGLFRHQSIFISTKGFTSVAKESAKSKQIKLLVLEGLTKDGMSKEISDAIFSAIYLFPRVKSWSIVDSEDFLFYDKNGEYKCSFPDLVLEDWLNKKELKIGEYTYSCENTNELYQKENDILRQSILSIKVESQIVALVFIQKIKASKNYLLNEENIIEKLKLNLNYINNSEDDFILFKSEDELDKYLNEQKENIKIKTNSIKIPKVKFENAFYPFEQDLIRELENQNFDFSRKEEIEKFIQEKGNTLDIFNKKIELVNRR